MAHANVDGPAFGGGAQLNSRPGRKGRLRVGGLLLAAWMTLVPSVGLAQDCADWVERTAPPGDREGHAMVYDSARGVTVLFGGSDNSYKGDTWEFAYSGFDTNCDGDRDLSDVAGFLRCFAPGEAAVAECVRFDVSGEAGVDAGDYAVLMNELTGPMVAVP